MLASVPSPGPPVGQPDPDGQHDALLRRVRMAERLWVQAELTAFGRIKGWVFGYVGEASPDVHRFVDVVSKRGAQKRWRAMGAASVQDARKVIKTRVIRRLGIEAARSHGRLILGRLAVII